MKHSAQTIEQAAPAGRSPMPMRPFCGLIEPILVDEPVLNVFAGSVSRDAARAAWLWVGRDLRPDLVKPHMLASGEGVPAEIEPVIPQILASMKEALDQAEASQESLRRLRAQTGRDAVKSEFPVILTALRHRAVLAKAQSFGKALNGIAEDAALGVALQSMPLQDTKLAAMLFHAAMGYVANPTRLISTAIRISGNTSEAAMVRSGFGPLIEACLAHAQNQLQYLQMSGPFADIDLACRSLERFHRLVRALTGYIEFARGSSYTHALATITKAVSDRVEPRLREVLTDLNMAMRRPREGADRVDNDAILAAINGIYLLSAVRDCRDSLALNAIFDQAWSQSGQAIEIHVQRNLELIRQDPADAAAGARMDAAIAMAQIRFNPEYADTLRRARQAAERRS
jgi:hypothetical protein